MADYPTDEELEAVKNWPYENRFELIDYLINIFWCPDWCITVKGKRVKKVWISTGGWSGNEDIMEAFKLNFHIWAYCWKTHRTGGHYYFEFRPYPKSQKNVVNTSEKIIEKQT